MSETQLSESDQTALKRGLADGLKRVNLKNVPQDVRDEYSYYVAGYALGFVGKATAVIVLAYYGYSVPV